MPQPRRDDGLAPDSGASTCSDEKDIRGGHLGRLPCSRPPPARRTLEERSATDRMRETTPRGLL
jgi:hypothetical protein